MKRQSSWPHLTFEDRQNYGGNAFEHIKKSLASPPLLAFPDRRQIQILTTDASGVAIGAILSKSATGSAKEETVIAYESRILRGPELRYSAVHQEALAVVWAVQKFRHYLLGRGFVLRTDNSVLTFVLANKKPSPKLQRWAAALMEFDFSIVTARAETIPRTHYQGWYKQAIKRTSLN